MAAIEGKITSVAVVPLDAHGQPSGAPVPLHGFRDFEMNTNQVQWFEESVVRPLHRAAETITLTFQATAEALRLMFGPLLLDLYRRRAVRHYGVPESDIRRVDLDGIVHLWNWRKIDCSQGPAWDEM